MTLVSLVPARQHKAATRHKSAQQHRKIAPDGLSQRKGPALGRYDFQAQHHLPRRCPRMRNSRMRSRVLKTASGLCPSVSSSTTVLPAAATPSGSTQSRESADQDVVQYSRQKSNPEATVLIRAGLKQRTGQRSVRQPIGHPAVPRQRLRPDYPGLCQSRERRVARRPPLSGSNFGARPLAVLQVAPCWPLAG